MNARILFAALALVCAASLAEAKIIDANCTADEGGIVMEGWSWQWYEAEMTARMWVQEHQNLPVGHIYPTFTADSELDPFAYIYKEVENDTDYAWTDYHINLWLNKTFQIVSAVQPTGWLTPVMTQPSEISPGVWYGYVDYYYAGPGGELPTEIPIGGTGTFDVKVSFAGTANFTVEQIPTPEPASLSLLALGGLALLRRR